MDGVDDLKKKQDFTILHPKLAFITGITGQDGFYLTELLLEQDYNVFGMIRMASSYHTNHLEVFRSNPRLRLSYGDVTDFTSIFKIFTEIEAAFPGYSELKVFHLAAQSQVQHSFELPSHTFFINANGTMNMLDCIERMNLKKRVKFYNAATSELFGDILESRQNEETQLNPISPYAVAKHAAYSMVKIWRKRGYFAVNGILQNHESQKRGAKFITRKSTIHVGQVVSTINKFQLQNPTNGSGGDWPILPVMYLGNLNSLRDWSWAKDMVRGMLLMLEQDEPEDFLLSSDENHSVRYFIETAFAQRNLTIRWVGEGVHERGHLLESACKDYPDGQVVIQVSAKFFRPCEVNVLLGDSTKARTILGWKPEKNITELITHMLETDCPDMPLLLKPDPDEDRNYSPECKRQKILDV